MAMKQVFKNSLGSCQYVFKNGTVAHFIDGTFYTDEDYKIAELKAEIASKHPSISYEGEVDEADLDPIAVIEKKAIERYKAEQEALAAGTTDAGNTDPAAPKLVPASSANLGASLMKASNSAAS